MKRIAYTTAPHPITGHDAFLEIFEAGQDSVMRCRLTARDGIDTIVYAGKQPEAVIRETGLFWNLDGEASKYIPAIAWAKAQATNDEHATVTVYDDGSGRALLQRVSDGPNPLTVTWKSPEYDPQGWIEANAELDWQHLDPRTPAQATPAEPAPIVDAEGFTINPHHVHFAALKLSIGWAVTYQDAGRSKAIDGGVRTKGGMRWPVLVPHECQDEEHHEELCKTVAAILERNKAEMGAK